MKRKTVPIVAGSKKVLGMSNAEWGVNIIPFAFYMVFVPGAVVKTVCVVMHAVLITAYVQISKRYEEDLLVIVMQNRKIPNIVYGMFNNPLPLNKMISRTELLNPEVPLGVLEKEPDIPQNVFEVAGNAN